MIYALIVAVLSLAGAIVPLRFRLGHASLQIYLSLAAGALLGAAMFHLLPEAAEYTHGSFGLPTTIGIVSVFFLQRYLAPHSHETPTSGVAASSTTAKHEHGLGGICHHDHGSDVSHSEPRQSGFPVPILGGAIAILALSLHSFFDGVALGAATQGGDGAPLAAAVFLSVLIHKPMDGLSVSVLLLNAGVQRKSLWAVQLIYAGLVPCGWVAFWATSGAVTEASSFVGYTLAFSGGTFLAIALTDLLPELHFHSHDRNKLSFALLAGLALMGFTAYLGHGHEHQGTGGPSQTRRAADAEPTHVGHDH